MKIEYVQMKIEPMNTEALLEEDDLLAFIGNVAGECYNSSRDRDACIKRALNCIKRGHHSPLEHYNITLKCLMDRGTSHAVVRHRHCAFQQSSTIYQKYKDTLPIVELPDVDPVNGEIQRLDYEDEVMNAVYEKAFDAYTDLISKGMPPHRARDVLPNALATNLIITTNLREYMFIMQRRTGPGDAIRMHAFAYLLRKLFEQCYPKLTAAFDEWYATHPL